MKVFVNITSWAGISGDAEHYYAKVCEYNSKENIYKLAEFGMPMDGEEEDLERVLDDPKEVKYLNKKDSWSGWKIGKKTNRFVSVEQIKKVVEGLYPEADSAYFFNDVLESEDRDIIERNPHTPKKTGDRIQIHNFQGFSTEFVNLTEGSIHEVIETPERYKGKETMEGVWVMGVTEPVKVLRNEYYLV